MSRTFNLLWFAPCLLLIGSASASGAAEAYRSHPPMRPLPTARNAPLVDGPKKFVDAARGDDAATGSEAAPWKTLSFAVRQLAPGDTLYVRGGTYYERPALTKSGTEAAPITLAGYPGELVVVDGGLREFAADPAGSWQPYDGGAPDEYVSTRTYPDADARRVPTQFLPGGWEPLWGIEDQRPLALGNFADSLVPLHGYRTATDFRAANEFWLGGKHEHRDVGNYCGPGLWFNRDTGRIHVRLAHTKLAGLGEHAYRGETDPRKVPLVVAVGFGDDVVRVTGIQHVVLRDFVFRGATGSPLVHVYGSQHVVLDHVTAYGGSPSLMLNASQHVRVTNCAFRGLAAPWTSRAAQKYRGTAAYQIVLLNNQPFNEDIEFDHCEFTDEHDFAFFRYAKNLRFHHNLVDNFNDDGIECGPKRRDHTIFVYANRIGRCQIPLSQHEFEKDESPVDHDPLSGVFVYRNVIDQRGGTYKTPPTEADPTGAFLHGDSHLASDHGSPTWPVIRFYQNTVLRDEPVFRDYFLFGLGKQGLRNTERDVFNNLFVQIEKVPGVGFSGAKEAGNVREGGNILWGVVDGPSAPSEPFAKFRASPLFADSKKYYEPGFTTHDRVVDPQFVALSADPSKPVDLRLQSTSPAVDAGLALPTDWPDPGRAADKNRPDVGALPLGAEPWNVGIDARVPLFGTAAK